MVFKMTDQIKNFAKNADNPNMGANLLLILCIFYSKNKNRYLLFFK